MSTTVGTATVVVVPSMSGFSKAVSSGLSSSLNSAGAAAGKSSGIKAGAGFSSGMAVKMGAVAGMVGSVASSALSAVTSSVGDAISRVDTLNSYPKVMQQMGYGASEAQASIDKLSAGIDGLPTALDDIAANAKSIALLTGDLGGATDTALALNNAFLASGSSSADASRGMTQYTQMLSKGTVDMQSWRTLQETMGFALRETANAMGYTGESATNDLYAALQSGEVTFDQFNAKLTELNEAEGGFAETAGTASAGIQTSFSNLETAVTRNLANIIDAFNESGALSETLDGMKSAVNGIGESIMPMAQQAGEAISSLVENVQTAFGEEGLASGASALTEGIASMVSGIAQTIAEAAPSMLEAAQQLLLGIVDGIAESIPSVVEGFTALVDSVCAMLDGNGGVQMGTSFLNAVGKLALAVLQAVPEILAAVVKLIAAVVRNIVSKAGSILAAGAKMFAGLVKAAANVRAQVVAKVASVIKGAVEKVVSFVGSMREAGANLLSGIWQGISDKVSWLYDKVTSIGGGIVNAIKSALGIHSPSRVMRDLFHYVGDGMALGLKDSASGVIRSALGVADGVADALSIGAPAFAGGTYDLATTYRAYMPAASAQKAGTTVNLSLDYHAGEDANQMACDIARALRRVTA